MPFTEDTFVFSCVRTWCGRTRHGVRPGNCNRHAVACSMMCNRNPTSCFEISSAKRSGASVSDLRNQFSFLIQCVPFAAEAGAHLSHSVMGGVTTIALLFLASCGVSQAQTGGLTGMALVSNAHCFQRHTPRLAALSTRSSTRSRHGQLHALRAWGMAAILPASTPARRTNSCTIWFRHPTSPAGLERPWCEHLRHRWRHSTGSGATGLHSTFSPMRPMATPTAPPAPELTARANVFFLSASPATVLVMVPIASESALRRKTT